MDYKEIKYRETYTATLNVYGEQKRVRVRITGKHHYKSGIFNETCYFIYYCYLDGFQHPISHARHGGMYNYDGKFDMITP